MDALMILSVFLFISVLLNYIEIFQHFYIDIIR